MTALSPAERVGELVVSVEGTIATVELRRPEHRNALSNELLEGLADALTRLDARDDVRCIVVQGSDDVFAAGADLRALQDATGVGLYLGARFRAWGAIRRVRTPTLSAVSGYCLGGGCELAIGCDVVVAAERARFGLPETALGLIPAAGGTQRLPRMIGRARAMDVILSGRLLTAHEAEAAGLISRVVADEGWREAAQAVAQRIADRAPFAQILAKEAVDAASDVPLEAGLELERKAFALAFSSAEAQEGIAAFLEKRTPSWRA
jgi:enoyl-CoA hydratase